MFESQPYPLPEEDTNNVEICGQYCRNIGSANQRDIIRNVMKREYGEDAKVFMNKGDQGFPNERKYIIDAKWWRQWCDYTEFDMI